MGLRAWLLGAILWLNILLGLKKKKRLDWLGLENRGKRRLWKTMYLSSDVTWLQSIFHDDYRTRWERLASVSSSEFAGPLVSREYRRRVFSSTSPCRTPIPPKSSTYPTTWIRLDRLQTRDTELSEVSNDGSRKGFRNFLAPQTDRTRRFHRSTANWLAKIRAFAAVNRWDFGSWNIPNRNDPL